MRNLAEVIDPASTTAVARTIIAHIANSAIEIAVARNDLERDGEPIEIQKVVKDLINVMTGDETGCLEPEDLTKENCEILWLVDQLEQYAIQPEPIPMVVHCPTCGHQHVDAPEPEKGWTNPPHKSHLCSSCGTIFRPADLPTVGVASITTRGSADTWPPIDSSDAPLELLQDCKHRRTQFIQGMFGSSGRESVSVCCNCGEFHIVADHGGVGFSIRFSLCGPDTLIAASQAFRTAIKGESVERLSKRVWKPLDFAGLRLYHVVCTYRLKNEDSDRLGETIPASRLLHNSWRNISCLD